jgi:hypothetical protein
MRFRRNAALTVLSVLLVAGAAWPTASCGGPPVDLSKALKVTDVVTGWYDAGIVQGDMNKLVPSISFRLTNVGTVPVYSVYITLSFRVVGDEQELGSSYVKAVGPDGLAGGASTPPMVARSALGYTGEQPRNQMLEHSKFVDAQVSLFAKSGSAAPVKIGEYKIERQLLTR